MVKRERNGDIIMNGTHYVTYNDYQKLQAENTRLVMLNAATEAECDKFMELSAELVDLLEACIAGETVYTNGFVRIIKDALSKAREVTNG